MAVFIDLRPPKTYLKCLAWMIVGLFLAGGGLLSCGTEFSKNIDREKPTPVKITSRHTSELTSTDSNGNKSSRIAYYIEGTVGSHSTKVEVTPETYERAIVRGRLNTLTFLLAPCEYNGWLCAFQVLVTITIIAGTLLAIIFCVGTLGEYSEYKSKLK